MDRISIGIIGSGVFGRYHALKCVARDDLIFKGVFANQKAQARALVTEVGGQVYKSAEALFTACDAVIIACPASFHADYALQGLSHNCHLLIEKPLATNTADAVRIAELAEQKNCTIQIGHQERFVLRAIGLDQLEEVPIRIHGKRLSPYSMRGTDTTVTMDLMSHDIDLVTWLMGGSPRAINSETMTIYSDHADACLAFLDFPTGRAVLEASRVETDSHREMVITYPQGTVSIDFNNKTLVNQTPFKLNADFADHPEVRDSLAAGLNEFLSAIREKRTPLISAQDGKRVVEIACAIDGIS